MKLALLLVLALLGGFVACALLTTFGVAIFDAAVSWPLIFLLSITPAFLFFSQRLRRPENLGYFNLLLPDETKLAQSDRFIVITNRLEGVSRLAGLFAALGVARLTLLK